MSPDERASRSVLSRLLHEIEIDRAALAPHLADVRDVVARFQAGAPPREWLTVGAVAVHAWFTGVETLLERVARALDAEVPQGGESHRALLAQMATEIDGIRPAILPASLERELARMLAFRHFFRHAYAVGLDAGKLRVELDRLLRIQPEVDAALDAWFDFLRAATRAP